MNSIELKKNSIEHDQDKFNEWLRSTLDEMKLIGERRSINIGPSFSSIHQYSGQDPMENQWPLYTTFYYLQLLEIFFENIAERQLLFDFFSIFLLELHDKETKAIDPPILSSSSSDDEDDRWKSIDWIDFIFIRKWSSSYLKDSRLNNQWSCKTKTNEKEF